MTEKFEYKTIDKRGRKAAAMIKQYKAAGWSKGFETPNTVQYYRETSGAAIFAAKQGQVALFI